MTRLSSGVTGVRPEAAPERALAPAGVRGVTQVQQREAGGAAPEGRAANSGAGSHGASLRHLLLAFAMPRLSHPDVLRADRHRALLEQLAAQLARPDETVLREVNLVIRRELARLAALQQQCSSLVKG